VTLLAFYVVFGLVLEIKSFEATVEELRSIVRVVFTSDDH